MIVSFTKRGRNDSSTLLSLSPTQSTRQGKEVSLSWLLENTPLWQEEVYIFATKALDEGMAEEALSGKILLPPEGESF